ncbi:hypothetical protein EDB19DRAFT_198685 [Suillus lakei]|nr:hypothetical protein EDB19DRAFT_198685 [Suillus lakei]
MLLHVHHTMHAWKELHSRNLTLLTCKELVLATVVVFNPTTSARCRLRIYCILRLFGRIACRFVVWAVIPAEGVCYWGHSWKARCCRTLSAGDFFWRLLGLALPIVLFGISVVLLVIGFSSHSAIVQLYLSIIFAFFALAIWYRFGAHRCTTNFRTCGFTF